MTTTIDRPKAIADQHAINAMTELITRLEAHTTPPSTKADGSSDSDRWFDWIGLSLTTYFDGMRVARNHLGPGRHQYLELGSGIGTKLILAHALGYNATGIEHHHPYATISRQLAPHCTVIHTDATSRSHTLDHTYWQANLIYNYGLAKDQEQHDQINQQIAQRMRSGALYFTPRQPFPTTLDHLAGHVWIKP